MSHKNKVQALYKLMHIFIKEEEITTDNPYILEELQCSKRTLERYLKELQELYNHIITIKKSKKKVYKLIYISDIIEYFFKYSHDVSELLQMAREFDPEIFKNLEKNSLKKLINKDKSIFVFKNYTMDSLTNPQTKAFFNELKEHVKKQKTLKITYCFGKKKKEYKNVRAFRLVFSNNNWYIAIIKPSKKLELLQLNFITNIKVSKKPLLLDSNEIQKYLEFLKRMQHALTLFGKTPKKAYIKATPNVAHYFKKDMKKLLPSQQFIKEDSDGSVIFSLEYTQELEILPLIQKWMPDLIILKPKKLQEAYLKKLQIAQENQIKYL